MTNYVICGLLGGLGNRLFVYSAAYIIHIKHKLDICILNTGNPHSALDYSSIFKGITDKDFIKEISVNSDIICQSNSFAEWNIGTEAKTTEIRGYFQYYPVLIPYENEIRSLFKNRISNYIEEINSKYDTKEWGFIHVRRGDYLNLPHYHYVQTSEYYNKAIKIVKEKLPNIKFYVIGNDIEWIKDQPVFQDCTIFEGNELETLALMTLCNKVAICGNSTFSWWGAFLGAYELRNQVIVPEKWIDEPNAKNLIPSEWTII